MQSRMQRQLIALAAACGLVLSLVVPAAAASRGFVVSYFVPGMYSTDGDCPDGKNPNAEGMLRQLLKEQGKSPDEIQKIVTGKMFNAEGYAELETFRGRIDGKPADVYLHPTSVPDPHIKTVVGKFAVGFNLDGREGPNDFVDPQTGEKGVDNQMFRVFGCFDRVRGTPDSMPTNSAGIWTGTRLGYAWLIEVNGTGNLQDDPNVEVGIYRGLQAVTRNNAGEVQSFFTYAVDPDPRMQNNRFHGTIKDGMFVSDTPIDFFMIADLRIQPYFDFKRAHLRLAFKPDGSVQGFIGGYLSWDLLYLRYAMGHGVYEFAGAINLPGVYYAMRRLADTDIDKDPVTGMRTRISATYQISGVPAFIMPHSGTATGLSATATKR
jgi:hypothetical protein